MLYQNETNMNLHQDRSKLNVLTNELEIYLEKEKIDSLVTQWRFEAIRSGKSVNDFLIEKLQETISKSKIESQCQDKNLNTPVKKKSKSHQEKI